MRTRADVNDVWQLSKRYKELIATREIALRLNDSVKAARCRIAADKIKQELYFKYKLII